LALQIVDELAIRIDYCEAGDRNWLAPTGIPVVLEMEESPSRRQAVGIE
jgi:hypothetical protein